MSFLKDRTFFLLSSVLLIILLILAGLYMSSKYSINVAGIQHNPQYSNISLNEQQQKVVNIALSDENVQSYLNGRRYAITDVGMQNSSLDTAGSYVTIECMNDDGSLDYHLLIQVDVQNNRVKLAIPEKPRP